MPVWQEHSPAMTMDGRYAGVAGTRYAGAITRAAQGMVHLLWRLLPALRRGQQVNPVSCRCDD